MDLERRPLHAEAVAVLIHVRGRRRRLAYDRQPHALPQQAGGLQRRDPVRLQDLIREEARGRCDHAGIGRVETRRSDRAGPRRGAAVVDRRRANARRRPLRLHGVAHARHRVDVPLQPLGSLGRVDRQRDDLARRRLVVGPLRPEHLLRLAHRQRRADTQMSHVDRGLDVLRLEGVHDGLALRRRRPVLALKLRQREVLAVRRRRRIAGRLRRLLHARVVRDEADLEPQLETRRSRSHLVKPLVGDRAVVHLGGRLRRPGKGRGRKTDRSGQAAARESQRRHAGLAHHPRSRRHVIGLRPSSRCGASLGRTELDGGANLDSPPLDQVPPCPASNPMGNAFGRHGLHPSSPSRASNARSTS